MGWAHDGEGIRAKGAFRLCKCCRQIQVKQVVCNHQTIHVGERTSHVLAGDFKMDDQKTVSRRHCFLVENIIIVFSVADNAVMWS